MEYFKSSLKSVLGSPTPQNHSSEAETIERLVDRLLSSTLLDDRRDACRALKALSRSYRVEVGAQGMDALKQILNIDKTDCEIVGLALDTLCNITNPKIFDEETSKQCRNHNIGEQFTEILIKNDNNLTHLLKFLEEYDFRVRWPTLKLLANLLSNRPKDVQEVILISPMGISKLMDMLSDSREVIRNDALLLLIQLTKGNTNIQKIVAFENAFDRIFDVISQEGGLEGGIVVEDSLLLMVTLLRGNYSNQNFFKEGSYIQKLTPMFQVSKEISDDNCAVGWSPQKVSNVHCTIQVIRSLVAPSGPIQSVADCQNIMKKCGLLQALCDILMVSGVPADILTETVCAVAEVIRGNISNQEYLSKVMAPSNPPRSAIVVLLMSMVNAKQPFNLRCAVLYCFQCFLYKSQTSQKQLVQTLLPQGNESSSLTTGHLLCGGLFSSDSLSNWFSAVALSHALIVGLEQKEQLLRVLLATNLGTPPVTLIQQCILLLQQNNKIQSKFGLLILLCRWISYSSIVVKNFLIIDSSVSYLIALLSSHESNEDLQEILLQSMCAFLIGMLVHFNDDSVSQYTKVKLCNIIENRIGLEKFQDILGGIPRSEFYSRSLKHPQPSAENASEVLLDYEFCKLFKCLEGVVLKTILNYHDSYNEKEQLHFATSSGSILISQYKTLIMEQDSQIQRLNESIETLSKEKEELKHKVNALQYEVNLLADQAKILKAAQTSYPQNNIFSLSHDLDLTNKDVEYHENKYRNLENSSSESSILIKELESKFSEKNITSKFETILNVKEKEINKLKKDQEDLLELLTDQDYQLTKYKKKLIAIGEQVDTDDSEDGIETDN